MIFMGLALVHFQKYWLFSAHARDLALFVGNGTKVKIPYEIKPPLIKKHICINFLLCSQISYSAFLLAARLWDPFSSVSNRTDSGTCNAGESVFHKFKFIFSNSRVLQCTGEFLKYKKA